LWDLHVGRGFFAGVAGGLSRQWESLCRG
jgi:hypothetical protein